MRGISKAGVPGETKLWPQKWWGCAWEEAETSLVRAEDSHRKLVGKYNSPSCSPNLLRTSLKLTLLFSCPRWGRVTHRFVYKCQIRVWTLFCDKKKVTEVFWVKIWHLEVWQRKKVWRILAKRWEVGRGMEMVDIDISQWFFFFFPNTDVIHAKESAWSPPCHWLLETAGTAPKLRCLLRDFNQTRLCYLGFLSQQQKLPSGSVLFNQFGWTISSVCSGRKPGQFCKVYRHSKISIAAFDPNLLSQYLCLLCGV